MIVAKVVEHRVCSYASGLRIETALGKAAPGNRVDRAREFSGQFNALHLDMRARFGDCGE